MKTSDKQFLSNSLKWMFLYLGISLAIFYLVPFPSSFVIIIITVIVISFMRRKLIMKNTGINIKRILNACFDSQMFKEFIDNDVELANSHGFIDTPSFIIVNSNDGSDPENNKRSTAFSCISICD